MLHSLTKSRRWAPLLALALILAGCGTSATARTPARTPAASPTSPATSTPAPTQHVYVGVTNNTTGPSTGNVYALNAADGSTTWTSATISGPVSAIAVADGTVYVLAFSVGGEILALRASDGKELWHVALSQSVDVLGGQGFALDNGTVYVGGTLAEGDHPNAVSAYRASDGTLLWRKTGLGTLSLHISAVNGVVYAAAMDSVTALRGSDGAVLWQRQSLSPFIDNTPVVADDAVYLAATGDVFALSATDGSVRWHYRAPADAQCACVHMVRVDGGQVYATGRSTVALSAANGSVVYSVPVTGPALTVTSAGGTVYSALYGGKLIATQASDGTPRWSVTLHPGSVRVGSALSDVLFVSSNDDPNPPNALRPGVIYALRPSDGSMLWQFQPAAGFVSDPVVGK